MAEYTVNKFFSNEGTRNSVRSRIIDEFINEPPGTGKGEKAAMFTYYVEKLIDETYIYLRRPAYLHNGFDFLICVEGINFNPNGRYRNYPKHEDIVNDLLLKREEKQKYQQLELLIQKIYECHELDNAQYLSLDFKSGLSTELILKTLKWMFIEQDIRYWNYSGRTMLWDKIKSIKEQDVIRNV